MVFPAQFNLADLDGSNGFVLNGDVGDFSGGSVSGAGDINGDGLDDLIIGAVRAAPNGSFSGESYVVFGSDEGFDAALNLSALDGSNGFVLNGIDAGDLSGFSVSGAGDINGDGLDDLIIGASRADPNGSDSGESYVVFGSDEDFDAALNLSALDGSNGFVLNGIDVRDYSGRSVSGAGDINGDGLDDLIIGASGADPNGSASGESYVVFGIAPNAAPDAAPDAVVTDEDTSLSGSVFADNGSGADTDPDGDAFSVSAVNGIAADVGTAVTLDSGARLTLNADGSFEYEPNGQFESLNNGDTATDSFTYTIDDGNGGTDTATATATVTIDGVTDNVAPEAINDAITTDEDTLLVGSVFADNGNGADVDGNGDTFTVTAINGNGADVGNAITLGNGTLTVNADGTFSLDPAGGYDSLAAGESATASFTYTIDDGNGGTDTATVDVVVTGINDAPGATDDQVSTGFETPITLQTSDLLANDTDIDSADLRIVAVSNAIGGTVVLAGTSSDQVFFTPAAGFSGEASFEYTLSDGNRTSTATTVVVVAENGLTLNGTNKRDTLVGAGGNDTIRGLNNNDTIDGLAGDDALFGDNGKDQLLGGLGDDTLVGGNGSDQLLGDLGDDTLVGGGARDRLLGGAGRDYLDGGRSHDVLHGGEGDDQLTGGLGRDTFVLAIGEGSDIITDFSVRKDNIGLAGGLSLGQLSFVGNDILLTSTNEVLATLIGVDPSSIKASRFRPF